MKFRDYLEESKKITGIKGTLGRHDDFNGSLKVEIAVETEDDKLADETFTKTSIYFEGNSWELKNVNISDKISHSKFKKEVQKAIEAMLAKDADDYFKEEDEDVYVTRKDATFEIWLDDKVIK